MFSLKRIAILVGILFMYLNVSLHAEQVNRDIHLSDKDYIEGMLLLKGKKGVKTIVKQINNCPYAKCRKSDLSEDNILATIQINVKKPDFKKAVIKLHNAVKKGNFLAADKLTAFLIKNLNYKSYKPNKYLLMLLERDLGLNYEQYKSILLESLEVGSNSKGCVSSYVYAQVLKNGYLDVAINKINSQKLFKKAYTNCPKDNFYSLMSKAELE